MDKIYILYIYQKFINGWTKKKYYSNNNIYKYNNVGVITPKKEKEININRSPLKKIYLNIKEESKNNSPMHGNNNYKNYKPSKSQKNIKQKKQDCCNFDEDSEELENIIEDRFINELTIKNFRTKNNYFYDQWKVFFWGLKCSKILISSNNNYKTDWRRRKIFENFNDYKILQIFIIFIIK